MPASRLYAELLNVVRRQSVEEAERLKRQYPLESSDSSQGGGDVEAGQAFYAATAMLDNPQSAAQGLELASRLITSGSVPPQALQGELSRLDEAHSLATAQLLSAALTLEGR